VKKLWLMFPALLLALTSMLTLGCPSDPPPPEIITDFDFTIVGSNWAVEIPVDGAGGFRITEGEQYRVTFNLEAANSDFYGSRVGGKLAYKDADDSDKVLAGWKWLNPPFITGPGTYRWTFTAGDKGTDGESEDIVSPATTPEGLQQYFRMNIQDGEFHQYPNYYEFRIKGGFTIVHYTPPAGTLQKTADINMDFSGSGHDSSKGIGNIEGAEFTKVQEAAGNGSLLKFYIINLTVSTAAGADGNAVGAVGNRDNVGSDNPNAQFFIPRGTPAQSGFSFVAEVEVEDALKHVLAGQSHLFVNMWGDGPAKCDKVELWEYK